MTIISIIQIVLSVALVALILLQQRGAALGGAFGGSSDFYSTKRGVEKIIVRATIVVAFLFLATALANALFF